jgi:hypothetical protein
MPYVHKGNILSGTPAKDEVQTLRPGRTHFASEVQVGETLYLFREDSKSGAKDGGLIARGDILAAIRFEKTWDLTVRFDGVAPKVPLNTRLLDAFTNRGGNSLGPFPVPVLTEIAEVWRNTTHQPLHQIGPEAGAWLDIYHFHS